MLILIVFIEFFNFTFAAIQMPLLVIFLFFFMYCVSEGNRKKQIDKQIDLIIEGSQDTGNCNNSPLEGFNVVVENSIQFFSNISLNLFLIFFSIILFFSYFNNKSIKKNIVLINLSGFFFKFFFVNFKNLVPNIRYERYYFIILTVFIFIIFENLGSFYLLELPFNSHAVITLFLSFILFFNYVLNIIINFNQTAYKKFVQKNVNIFFAIFLFFIELISFFIRPFSLGVRLFANILSGHILVHIFFTAFIFAFKFIFWFSLLILIFCLFILIMEIFVAMVQAYIFFVLNLIYLNETSKLHS